MAPINKAEWETTTTLAGPTRREWESLNLYWLVYWGWNFLHSLRVGPASPWICMEIRRIPETTQKNTQVFHVAQVEVAVSPKDFQKASFDIHSSNLYNIAGWKMGAPDWVVQYFLLKMVDFPAIYVSWPAGKRPYGPRPVTNSPWKASGKKKTPATGFQPRMREELWEIPSVPLFFHPLVEVHLWSGQGTDGKKSMTGYLSGQNGS